MAKFRLTAGLHYDWSSVLKDRDGKPIEVKFVPGEVFESKRDMASRWPERCVRVADDTPVSPGTPIKPDPEMDLLPEYRTNPPQQVAQPVPVQTDELDGMTNSQLRQIADNLAIHGYGGKGKAELIKMIRDARKPELAGR